MWSHRDSEVSSGGPQLGVLGSTGEEVLASKHQQLTSGIVTNQASLWQTREIHMVGQEEIFRRNQASLTEAKMLGWHLRGVCRSLGTVLRRFRSQHSSCNSSSCCVFPFIGYVGSFCRTSMIQPMQLGTDGKMRVMKGEDLHNLAHSPASQPQVAANSGSEDEPE